MADVIKKKIARTVWRPCAWCKKKVLVEVTVDGSSLRRRWQEPVYCSPKCSVAAYRARRRAK